MSNPAKRNFEYLEWARTNFDVAQKDLWSAWVLGDETRKHTEAQFEWSEWERNAAFLEAKTAKDLFSLGDVAAESDAVLDYFLITETTKSIEEGESVLILGRKGTGKTALVRYFTEDHSRRATARAISLDKYPWKIHETRVDSSTSEVEAYFSSWRYLIAVQFAIIVTGHPDVDKNNNHFESICRFLSSNYGTTSPEIGDVLRPDKLQISKTTLEPQVLGVKLGSISFEKDNKSSGRELSALTDELLKATAVLANSGGVQDLSLHFDELDRGLSTFDEGRKHMIIGLISAAIDVARESAKLSVRFRPIVYLRTDLWNALRFADKTKITYGRTISIEWESDSLKKLINQRILSQLANGAGWGTITSPTLMRGSQTKWDHILTRTFMRPRDVIQFLNSTLKVVHKRQKSDGRPIIICNEDVTDARTGYSPYLKSELDDELGSHWPEWDDALKVCSAISTVTFQYGQFVEEYNARKSSGNEKSADDALSTLFQYSVIGYEGRSGYGGSSWIFQYINPGAGWDSKATRFKVHAGLKEYAKLREERAAGAISSLEDPEESTD